MFNSFDLLEIPRNILKGIYYTGYEKPSEMQTKSIPILLTSQDVFLQSHSGSGKTLAYLIGVLHKIDETQNHTQAIIIAPTRELSFQILNIAKSISHYTETSFTCVTGGETRIKKDANVIVGTPGRILHLLNENFIKTEHIEILVIDECDEMEEKELNLQVEKINMLIKNSQRILVSATLLNTFETYCTNPVKILLKQDEIKCNDIKHYLIECKKDSKFNKLISIYEEMIITQSIIFANKADTCEELCQKMRQQGFEISFLHSKIDNDERKKIFKRFSEGRIKNIVSTDIISRGIDISQVNLVVNYDLPKNMEDYIHRVGRGGRFGRKSVAVNLISKEDTKKMRSITNTYNIEIEKYNGGNCDI